MAEAYIEQERLTHLNASRWDEKSILPKIKSKRFLSDLSCLRTPDSVQRKMKERSNHCRHIPLTRRCDVKKPAAYETIYSLRLISSLPFESTFGVWYFLIKLDNSRLRIFTGNRAE